MASPWFFSLSRLAPCLVRISALLSVRHRLGEDNRSASTRKDRIAHEVTKGGHDRGQLSNMAKLARDQIGAESLTVVADRGYYTGTEIVACEQAEISPFVLKLLTSSSKAEDRFGKQDFLYVSTLDEYRCLVGNY